jgi:acyl-CoA synthetase (AMP-forming)/AMP-acid ligase II
LSAPQTRFSLPRTSNVQAGVTRFFAAKVQVISCHIVRSHNDEADQRPALWRRTVCPPIPASDYVAQRLGRAFRPSVVHIVGSLPRTRSSKVMRRVLRNIYTGSPPGDLSSLDNPASIDENSG